MAGELNILHDHHAAWPCGLDHPLQCLLRLAQVGQHETPENKVVRGHVLQVVDQASSEISVHAAPLRFLSRQFQAARIQVDVNNVALRPNAFSDVQGNGTDAAADVLSGAG